MSRTRIPATNRWSTAAVFSSTPQRPPRSRPLEVALGAFADYFGELYSGRRGRAITAQSDAGPARWAPGRGSRHSSRRSRRYPNLIGPRSDEVPDGIRVLAVLVPAHPARAPCVRGSASAFTVLSARQFAGSAR